MDGTQSTQIQQTLLLVIEAHANVSLQIRELESALERARRKAASLLDDAVQMQQRLAESPTAAPDVPAQ